MSDALKQLIEGHLRNGKAREAIVAAKQLCQSAGATKETAIDIAKGAATVYRDLITPPIHEFAEMAGKDLPAEVGPIVAKALSRLIRMTEDWEKKLWEVHTERLAREMREWIRMRHVEAAGANVARLMALAPAEQRAKRAQFIGSTLGTVINNQKEAKELITRIARAPQDFYLDLPMVNAMDQAREQRTGQMVGVNLDVLERGYTSTLSQVVVDIKNVLPEQNKMEEPDEAVLRDVGDIFRSILRVPLWREEADLLLDATHLFVEFTPKAQGTTARSASVEARAYGALGFTAKKAVALVFQEIGRNEFFATIYKQWAKGFVGTDAIKPIVEFMGALRSAYFNEFLQGLKGDKRVSEIVGAQLTSAMGSIAGAESSTQLMSDLRVILARKRIESADIRDAEGLLTALGNVVKSPRTDADERHRIQEFLRQHVPEDLTRVATTAALQAFTFKPEEQHIQSRHWAIRVLARGLWAPDETTSHHKGADRQANELGFRGEIVEALRKIASREPQVLSRAIEPMVMRYGAAYMAAAELFEKINDAEFLHLLDRMLTNVLMHDESRQNAYQQEFYWDAGTQQRIPITKDKLLSPIVFAIGHIGGDRSREILRRYQDGIATHRVPPPSPQVAEFLQRFLGASIFSGAANAETGEAELAPMGKEEQQALLRQLTKGYLLSSKETRRLKKIEALTRFAQATPIDALDAVFEHLGDKDPMVVSAAITCLSEYALPNKPKTQRDLTVNGCIDRLMSKDPAVRVGAQKALKEMGPNRDDVKSKLLAFAKHAERPETKHAIAELLRTGSGAAAPADALAALAQAEGGSAGGAKKAPDAMSKLEVKRQYIAARQAWLASGKKGDPPPRPAGIDD